MFLLSCCFPCPGEVFFVIFVFCVFLFVYTCLYFCAFVCICLNRICLHFPLHFFVFLCISLYFFVCFLYFFVLFVFFVCSRFFIFDSLTYPPPHAFYLLRPRNLPRARFVPVCSSLSAVSDDALASSNLLHDCGARVHGRRAREPVRWKRPSEQRGCVNFFTCVLFASYDGVFFFWRVLVVVFVCARCIFFL